MSIASISLPDHSSIESATVLEMALARVIADARKEWATVVQISQAETRAAVAELNICRKEMERMRAEFAIWFEREAKLTTGPIGAKGEKGEAGAAGRDGQPGRDGLNGLQGPEGTKGKDGRDGSDGKDGLGMSDLKIEYDNERSLIFAWANAERRVEQKIDLPIVIYRGVWRKGKYLQGDAATYGGSLFIAKRETENIPETDDWQCAVKRGQNGKNGKDGERGSQGPDGRPGRDLTQLMADGRKY